MTKLAKLPPQELLLLISTTMANACCTIGSFVPVQYLVYISSQPPYDLSRPVAGSHCL